MPLAQLPDFYKLPEEGRYSKDEQQTKVNEMVEKSQSHQAEAAKKIEGKWRHRSVLPSLRPPHQPNQYG